MVWGAGVQILVFCPRARCGLPLLGQITLLAVFICKCISFRSYFTTELVPL